MNLNIFSFIYLALAVARLSFMIAEETGPADIFAKFRSFIGVKYNDLSIAYGTNNFAQGWICVYCNSVWIGIILTGMYYFIPNITLLVATPFALSQVAIFINKE